MSAEPVTLGGGPSRKTFGRYGLRTIGLGYLALLLIFPVILVFVEAFDEGIAHAMGVGDHAGGAARLLPDDVDGRDRGAAEHGVRRADGARPGPPRLPRQGVPQRPDRPSVRDLAGRDRSFADPRLRQRRRLVRPLARRERDSDDLHADRDGDRDDVRLPAVRRPRGRAGPARDRDRSGGGRLHARRRRLADLLADHAARRSAGASPTASFSRPRGRWASSARSASSPGGSRARPRPCRSTSRSSSRSSTCRAPTRPPSSSR